MSDEHKICPLRMMVWKMPDDQWVIEDAYAEIDFPSGKNVPICIRSRCAWWNDDRNCCAVQTFSETSVGKRSNDANTRDKVA